MYPELNDGFDPDAYNAMPGVETAYKKLRERCELQELLDASAEVFRSHSMGGFGMFLLHRHFKVGKDSRIIETRRRMKRGRYALVSKVRRLSEAQEAKGASPCRWRWNPKTKRYEAIEFSNDDFVSNGNRILAERPAFAKDYAEVLERFDVTDLLGLAIGRREGLLLGKDEVYVETTDLEFQESILEIFDLTPEDFNRDDMIPTLWTHEDGDCWCSPATVCKAYCFGVGDTHTPEHAAVSEGHEKVPCV